MTKEMLKKEIEKREAEIKDLNALVGDCGSSDEYYYISGLCAELRKLKKEYEEC